MSHDAAPEPEESIVEMFIVGAAMGELAEPPEDELAAMRRALLVLLLITDHDQQREALRVFRTFLLGEFQPLTRAFRDHMHPLVAGLDTLAWPAENGGISLHLNVKAVERRIMAMVDEIDIGTGDIEPAASPRPGA